MFNKPSLASRNDPITRKDVNPVLGSSTKNLAGAVPEPKVLSESSTSDTMEKNAIAAESEKPVGAHLIVGPDVKLKGAEILDCDTLVVEGRVEATMDSRVVRIAEKGAFSGKVSIDVAEIYGVFEGELTARSQLIIHATGRVSGKIRYGKLVIDEGGELCGDINALSSEKKSSPHSYAESITAQNVING